MKPCIECGEHKDRREFYTHPATADGLMGMCKSCHKARMRKRRRENPKVQAYDRERAKLPHRKAKIAAVSKRWRRRNPEKYAAETAVGNALRDGKLIKGVCEVCGRRDVHAHHDDYAKTMEVRWLCPMHHHRHHASLRAEGVGP